MSKSLSILFGLAFSAASLASNNPSQLSGHSLLKQSDEQTDQPNVSPIRRIQRAPVTQPETAQNTVTTSNRTIDGAGNNISNTQYGAAHEQLRRLAPANYSDNVSTLAGSDRPNPRAISNAISAQSNSMPNTRRASDYLWQWGQFLDHDLDLTDGVNPAEAADISIPSGDPFFDPANTGSMTMSFNRSIYDLSSGVDASNPRQQINEITSWIDASNVYGSDITRANTLRTNDNTGKLKTSNGNLLPFNTTGLANAGGTNAALFLAGDVRANEQIGLATMHTLFVREHNRLAEEFSLLNPSATGNEIYEYARKMVGAMMQQITYEEFLPVLLGENALTVYAGYDDSIDPTISNLFSTSAYRFGHSALSPQLLRLDQEGNEITEGHLSLRNAFFSPQILSTEGGIDPILRGLAKQQMQQIDVFVIDDVRNFLFGQPGLGGFDLVSLNIQRGRDHGLPSYNNARIAVGLTAAADFADITSNVELQSQLQTTYGTIDKVDAWVGGLAEDHVDGAMIGELNFTIIKQQFEALRDGDRFWYENDLNDTQIAQVKSTRLSDIIKRNTSINAEIQENVFVVPSESSGSSSITHLYVLFLIGLFVARIKRLKYN